MTVSGTDQVDLPLMKVTRIVFGVMAKQKLIAGLFFKIIQPGSLRQRPLPMEQRGDLRRLVADFEIRDPFIPIAGKPGGTDAILSAREDTIRFRKIN